MSRDDYLHQQAWNYFALHAQQRLTTVNFYLVLATALTAAAGRVIRGELPISWYEVGGWPVVVAPVVCLLEARFQESRADQGRGNRAPRPRG